MQQSSHVSVRIDRAIKMSAQDELAKRGLSLSAYIKLMLTDVAEHHRVLYPTDGGEGS